MAVNTVSTFAGFLKTNYADNVVNTIPDDYVFQQDVPFGMARKIGEQYQQAVITRLEQGGTYSRGGQGAFSLQAAQAGSIDKALLDASQFVLKSGIDYETLAKAVEKGKLAYGSSGDQLLKSMAMSTRKRLEIDILLGQWANGLGVIDTGGVSGAVYTISAATWAPGVWIAMEGALTQLFNAALDTRRSGSGTNDEEELTGIDIEARELTVDSAHTSAAATDRLFLATQRTTSAWNSFLGILEALSTTTGSVFNISVASNSIWRPNSYAVGGQMSFTHLQKAMVTGQLKGLSGKAICYTSTAAWVDLLTEQAAMRRYGGEFDGRVELVNGGQAIKFQSASGVIEIKPTTYMPQGYSIIVPADSLVRVGATDVTFRVPGMDMPLAQISDTTAGMSLFSYYNQAVFTAELGQCTVLTGITVS